MENPVAAPSISPQPAVSSPTESPNRSWFFWLIGGLVLLVFGIAIGLFSAKFLSQSQGPSPLTSTPTPSQSPTPTSQAKPDLAPPDTANWETYTNSSLGYSFSYPQSASIEVYGDSTVVRIDPSDPRMIVGICPRWISFSSVGSSSSVKTTQDKYECVYNAFVSEEKVFVESQYHEGSQKIIDQILSTFKFLDQNTVSNSCAADADCGVNICDCKAELKQNIPEAKKICAGYCPGTPRCINNQCQLVND